MKEKRYSRIARVNEVVKQVVAEELELMSDPRLELVTITGVEVSPDLKRAKVFYSALEAGDEDADGSSRAATAAHVTSDTEGSRSDAAKALASARRHLQAALGEQVRLKYVPRLAFVEDPAILEGQRIEEIIRQLHEGEP